MPDFSDIHVVPCREKLGKKLGIGFREFPDTASRTLPRETGNETGTGGNAVPLNGRYHSITKGRGDVFLACSIRRKNHLT